MHAQRMYEKYSGLSWVIDMCGSQTKSWGAQSHKVKRERLQIIYFIPCSDQLLFNRKAKKNLNAT